MAFTNSPEARFAISATDKTGKTFKKVDARLKQLGDRAKVIGGLVAGVALVRGIKVAADFEQSLADLSAITGATGEQLAFLSKEARDMGRTTTLSASQAAEAFKLVASGKPELLESSEALAAVTRETITLAEAAGITMPEAADALTASLNQYGAGADQANRFINVLAAGSKFGASAIELTSEALEKVGTVAGIAGISFEELNANIQGLAGVAIKGSDAGTALRNAILKLQNQANPDFNPAIVGLTQAFKNLGASGISTTEQMELVGLRTISATQALIKQAGSLDELEKKMTGTNIAAEQAHTRTDTLKGDVKRLNSAYEDLSIEIGTALNPAMREAVQLLTDFTNGATLGLPSLEDFLVYGITAWNVTFLKLGASMNDASAKLSEFSAKVTFGEMSKRHQENARASIAAATELWQRASSEMEIRIQMLDDREERLNGKGAGTAGDEKRKAAAAAAAAAAREAAAAAAASREAARATEIAKKAEETAADLETLKVAKAEELEVIQSFLLSEQDAETQAHLNRLLVVEENRELGIISLNTYNTITENLEQKHQDKLAKIRSKSLSQEQKDWQSGQQGKLKVLGGVMGSMTTLMNSESRKMFAIGKAAAISETVINTYLAAQKVFTALAWNPPLAAAAAAAAVASGLVRVQAIASQQFGGGTVSNAGAGGGVATPVVGVDSVSGLATDNQIGTGRVTTTEVVVSFGSQELFPAEQVRALIESINEQIDDGVNVGSIKVA